MIPTTSRSPSRPSRGRRPSLEVLEDRCLLSIVVDTLDDVVDPNDNMTSLREAVALANVNAGPDTIEFQTGLNGTIALDHGQMEITESLTITGNGAALTVIDAQQSSRIFDAQLASGQEVTLQGLTLTGGRTTESGGAVLFRFGGTLTLRQSILSGNSALAGGAIFAGFPVDVNVIESTLTGNTATGTRRASGGAIYTAGGVNLIKSTVSGNSAVEVPELGSGLSRGGGAILAGGDVNVIQSTVSGNFTRGGWGGAIFNSSAVNVIESTVSGNFTTGGNVRGGAILSRGSVSVSRSTVSGNSTTGGFSSGGAIFADNGVTVRQSTITGNRATGSGGGIFTYGAEVTNSVISHNEADVDGGGIVSAFRTITVTDSVISRNKAGRDGGGIWGVAGFNGSFNVTDSVISRNVAGQDGGGIFFDTFSGGALTLNNVVLFQNEAGGDGGGLYVNNGMASIFNSTFFRNKAGSGQGSAIYVAPAGSLDLDDDTVIFPFANAIYEE